MSKMLVIVFDDEKTAYEGSKALTELHRDGSISIYSGAVVVRDANGTVSVKDDVSDGPIGTGIGMMTGALVGVLGGPAGVVAGTAAGGLIGSLGDMMNLGVGLDFLEEVSGKLEPGKCAVVAEVEETWVTPVDSRMQELGGEVFRRYRADVEDEQIERDIAAASQEWKDLKNEVSTASAENKAKLKKKMEVSKAKLSNAKDRAKARLDVIEKEHDERISAIKTQLASSSEENRGKLERSAEKIRANHIARGKKLKESWSNTKEMLSS